MDYNSYYPAQSGQPPPPIPNQQHGCSQMQLMPGPPGMMHTSLPPQNIRQVVTPGPPPGHQQMQQQPPPQSQHLMSHQQQHPNYHQLPPHSALPPPPSHSGSPHQMQQPHHSHPQNMSLQPPPRPSTGPSPQQHPMHQQSPHHMNGPPIHVQQQPPPPLNQISGPSGSLLPPNLNPQHQPSMHPHQHNFIGPANGSIPHQSPHYSPQNQQPPPPPPPHNQPPLPPMHHSAQPPPPAYLPHVHQPIERGSPFYQNIPQTEFRIIELNKRLQNRPKFRGPVSPLPLHGSSDESYWWEKFACDFFDDDATLTLRISPDDKPAEYTIGRTLIPRFFRSYFEGGVVDLSIKLRNTREAAHPHMITLECDQTDITTKYHLKHSAANMAMNVVVHTEGHLSLEFVSNSFDTLLIKSWRFYTHQCHEYIDRSMTTTGLPNAFLVDPVTRHGLTTSTISYLKMCMIMEPMQELMFHHRQTKMDPKSCLKHLLHDKYKHKNVEDNRVQPNKRRKRKTPTVTGATGTNKRGKANANNANAMNNNNIGFNNVGNSLMSPSIVGGVPNLPHPSQEILVVTEPSVLGSAYGDENERRITRLENNQFDASINSNNGNNNNNSNNNNTSIQNQNQMYNETGNQNPNQTNSMNHMQQQKNHDTSGSIQMMNHTNISNSNSSSNSTNNNNSNNNNSNNNNNNTNNNNNGTGDPNNSNVNNGNNCLQNNNNNSNSNSHQMNLISMNGNFNHVSHPGIKSEIDLKPPAAMAPTTTDS